MPRPRTLPAPLLRLLLGTALMTPMFVAAQATAPAAPTGPVVAPSISAPATDPAELFTSALRDRVGLPLTQDELVVDGLQLRRQDAVTRLYLLRSFIPAWIDANGQPVNAAGAFISHLRGVATEGLVPEYYRPEELASRLTAVTDGQGSLDQLVDLELLLSDAWLTLAGHLLRGRVDPEVLYGQWLASPRERDLVSLLDTALASGDPVDVLGELAPAYSQYARLRAALAELRQIDPASEPPRVASGFALRLGDEDERVPSMRRRLRYTGDLPEGANLDDTRFDGLVDAALLSFQARHGLEADGIFGRGTRSMLNRSVADLIAQVEINMERFRWLPRAPEPRHLRVNIADFSLELVEENEVVMTMGVIVGKPFRQTPVFSGSVTYLVFSPSWLGCERARGRPGQCRLAHDQRTQPALPLPPGSRSEQRVGTRQVHVPEPLQRLPPRHPGQAAVRPCPARFQQRLHPRRAARRSRHPPAAGGSRVDTGRPACRVWEWGGPAMDAQSLGRERGDAPRRHQRATIPPLVQSRRVRARTRSADHWDAKPWQ